MTTRYANILWLFSFSLMGCVSYQPSPVHIVSQTDAPIQIVAVKQRGDNLLASLIVKNTTDRTIDSFSVIWSIYRPARCASGRRASEVTRFGQSAMAEVRGLWEPPGATWPSRSLQPHEQTEITSLSLTTGQLSELEQKYSAQKLAVQIAISN